MSLKAAIAALLGHVEPTIKVLEHDFTTTEVAAKRTIHEVIGDVEGLAAEIRSLITQSGVVKATLTEKQAALAALQAEYTKMAADVGADITALTTQI
jgi:hypothetical protein